MNKVKKRKSNATPTPVTTASATATVTPTVEPTKNPTPTPTPTQAAESMIPQTTLYPENSFEPSEQPSYSYGTDY